MTDLLQATWGGVLSGSVYGLMALGLTLIWGALRLLNLAHGALYVIGAYVAWTAINIWGLPLLVALALGVAGAALAGLVMYGLVIRPMLGAPGWDTASIIATVAVAIAVQAAALIIYGPQVKQIPAVIGGSYLVSGVLIRKQGLFIVALAVIFLVAMNMYLKSSRQGMGIRAVSQQMDAARLMGVRVDRTFAVVMVMSAALAGLAGVLLSSFFFLSPTSGFTPMIIALLVTIFGGLGSVKGTIVAAYVIGLLEASVQVYFGSSWALPALFLFMIVVLVVRPSGLYGVGEVARL